MNTLAVLLTCHNRREKTFECLEALFVQDFHQALKLTIYLVDDGSTDDTSTAIAKHFPQVKVLQGTGNLYWNGGMRLAFSEAMKENHDYYLWLNDDTTFFPQTVAKLLDTSARLGNQAIISASIQDPESGQLTYGGFRQLHRCRPLKFTLVEPEEKPVPVETMNGNCVLIPKAVVQKVGNLDPAFTHGMGDFDYGLRARKLGVEIFLAPGYYGTCLRNPPAYKNLHYRARWKRLLSPQGIPPREWAVFAKRYAGFFWFIFWVSPYVNFLIRKKDK